MPTATRGAHSAAKQPAMPSALTPRSAIQPLSGSAT
jgi:hypothetical protein